MTGLEPNSLCGWHPGGTADPVCSVFVDPQEGRSDGAPDCRSVRRRKDRPLQQTRQRLCRKSGPFLNLAQCTGEKIGVNSQPFFIRTQFSILSTKHQPPIKLKWAAFEKALAAVKVKTAVT